MVSEIVLLSTKIDIASFIPRIPISVSQQAWIKDANEHEDKKLKKSFNMGRARVHADCCVSRNVASGMHGKGLANIIDETLISREEVIERNANQQGLSSHNNKWPVPHEIISDGKLTYSRKANVWKFASVYETQKQLRETQADDSLHAVSTDPGVRTPFT
ncbi:hypothetical protein G9A89_022951 [Geosiphon pyriformis]|nr:hypothetical protein G9A89_022951 [Geosiphon pyriformis]